MKTKLDELKNRLAEVHDLGAAGSVLGWDQLTCMPAGGTPARARQIATLARLQQEKFTDPALGKLLDELQPYADSLPYDTFDAALVRVTRRDYDRMVKIPAPFIAELSSHQVEAFQVWAKARPENDFGVVEPYLEKTLEFSRKMAEFFPGYEHIADPLIDFADYGMKAESIDANCADDFCSAYCG
jgi:carboxypeptidase Taq